jgi:hypothetical protein
MQCANSLASFRVDVPMFARWEQEAFGTRATEYLSALTQFKDSRARIIIHGNRAEARIGLAASDRERVAEKIHVPPVQISDAPVARLQRLSEPLPVYKKCVCQVLPCFTSANPPFLGACLRRKFSLARFWFHHFRAYSRCFSALQDCASQTSWSLLFAMYNGARQAVA